MAGESFRGDPLTGQGTFTDASGNEQSGDISTFFDGRFFVSNGSFIDRLDIMNPTRIGTQGDFSFSALRGNNFQLVSQTTRGQVNRGFGTHTVYDDNGNPSTVPNEYMRMVSGTANIVIEGETVDSFEVPVRPVAGVGMQWVKYSIGGGKYDYRKVAGPFNNSAEVQEALGANYQLATGAEAAKRALFALLLADNQPVINALLDRYGLDIRDPEAEANYGLGDLFEMVEFTGYDSYTSTLFKTPKG